MKWVKATERLPENGGIRNTVVIRTDGTVAYGFRNFDENNPKIYYEDAGKSYLGNEGVEWLDESHSDSLTDINGELLADLRNKMTPPYNLAQMVIQEGTMGNRFVGNFMIEEAKRVIEIINIITQKIKPDVPDAAH